MARVSPSRDGFTIRGIAPPELRGRPDEVRLIFWSFVLDATLGTKDRELAQGLDKDGRPLRPISAYTRAHRRSMMTPTGRGDPSAPPLMPGRALSRTRSLLTGRAFADRCEIYWRYDPFTYDSWARVLRAQRSRGRDVIGLSPAGLATVTAASWRAFRAWAATGMPGPPPHVSPAPAPAPVALPILGRTRMTWAESGIGAKPHRPGAQTSGGLSWPEWMSYLRRPAPAPSASGRRRPFSNLLRFLFGH